MQVSSIRRVVKTPERWNRIVELAAEQGEHLPAEADSKALNEFLMKRKAADPDHFADLSLAVIKLMGPGEYVLERPGDPEQGHFGLAVQDYTHSTAPQPALHRSGHPAADQSRTREPACSVFRR
jgi:exoribonuclease-2